MTLTRSAAAAAALFLSACGLNTFGVTDGSEPLPEANEKGGSKDIGGDQADNSAPNAGAVYLY